MQVYRELRILTARPGPADTAQVTHRLYGSVPAGERFSAAAWRAQAVDEIKAAASARQLPIVCGGTGLYIRALMEGLAEIPPIPEDCRAAARTLYDRIGGEAFRTRLKERDSESAQRLAPSDRQRLIRAWEVVEATGRPLSAWQSDGNAPIGDFAFAALLLDPPRRPLYASCLERFDQMMAAGALDEVRWLLRKGLDPDLPAMKALGVPELAAHLRGEIDLETAVAQAKQATRNYVKRQSTWFRHQYAPDLTLSAQYSESLKSEIFSFIREFLLTHAR